MKQVNTLDLKSSGSDALPVRFRPVAPSSILFKNYNMIIQKFNYPTIHGKIITGTVDNFTDQQGKFSDFLEFNDNSFTLTLSHIDIPCGVETTHQAVDQFINFNDNFKVGNIQSLIDLGFSRVANVYLPDLKSNLWNFKDMDPNLMFSKKEGWVYAITLEGDIYKIGMTGTVLGRRAKRSDVQPVAATDNRLGRYRGDFTNYNTDVTDTDERIRRELYQHLLNGAEVSFYAKSFAGQSKAQIEQVEKTYLTEYMNQFGKLPLGNHELG